MKNALKTYNVPPWLSWLFPYKKKNLFVSIKSPVYYYLFQNKISLTCINWLFQGMMGMGTADLIGKIVFEALAFTVIFFILGGSVPYRIGTVLIIAHTLNWLLNANFWVIGRYNGITRTPPSHFSPYLQKIRNRINRYSSIPTAIVIGGITRNKELKTTSDVDLIFIRGRGFKNALKAVLVTISERARAFFSKFPLHLELYDSIEFMKKHRTDEVPIVLKDINGTAKDLYSKAERTIMSLEDCTKF